MLHDIPTVLYVFQDLFFLFTENVMYVESDDPTLVSLNLVNFNILQVRSLL